MAACDYRLCDVCECKVFYDANLNYEFGKGLEVKLESLGDWKVICCECAKRHQVVVVPIARGEDVELWGKADLAQARLEGVREGFAGAREHRKMGGQYGNNRYGFKYATVEDYLAEKGEKWIVTI